LTAGAQRLTPELRLEAQLKHSELQAALHEAGTASRIGSSATQHNQQRRRSR
jgi:hypothetical protein